MWNLLRLPPHPGTFVSSLLWVFLILTLRPSQTSSSFLASLNWFCLILGLSSHHTGASSDFLLNLVHPLLHSETFSSSLFLLLIPSFFSLWDFFLFTPGFSHPPYFETSSDFLLTPGHPPSHSETSSSLLWDLLRRLPLCGTSSDCFLLTLELLPPGPMRLSHLCSSYFSHYKQIMLQSRVYYGFFFLLLMIV